MPALLQVSNKVGFTKPPRGKALWFGADVAVRKQDEIVASSTFGNSTAETTIASMTIPPLALSNQGGARAYVGGTIRDDANPSETVVIRSKLAIGGSTVTIAETSAISLSPSTLSREWASQVILIGTTLSTQLRLDHYVDVTAPSTYLTKADSYAGGGNSLVTVPSSTGTGTLSWTLQFSAASTDIGAAVQVGVLETLA